MAKEKPLNAIIDREIARALVKSNHSETNDLLIDLVNYGSNLIARAFDQSSKNLSDSIIIGHFTKSAVAALDSIQIGFCEGSYLTIKLASRALLEISFQLEWVLKSDTEKRSKQFYVSLLRRKKRLNRLYTGSDSASQELFTQFRNRGFNDPNTLLSSKISEISEQNNAIDNILSKPEYDQINQDFDSVQTRNFDKNWYSLYGGPNTIRQLAKRLDKMVEYDVMYSSYSQYMHSSHFEKNVSFDSESIIFENIRDVENSLLDINFSCSMIFRVYRMITQKYLPSESEQFSLKYIQDWRDSYQKTK